ncbi:MAG: hypothetical protein ACKO6B_01370 [Planctomycetia bacterium]
MTLEGVLPDAAGPRRRIRAPRIFVLNNGIYGVEDVLGERGHPYDGLTQVNRYLLPEAFGCKGWSAEGQNPNLKSGVIHGGRSER